MTIDATFWVTVSFFIFLGILIYFKIPQKIRVSLEENILNIKKQINDAEKLKEEAKNILTEHEKKISNSKIEVNTMIDKAIQSNNYDGRYIHYGVREHAMCAIANGLSNCGFIPYVGTFLVFINYCLCAIRMSALSGHKVIYILTHDSVGLGEDGPTHQPIESLTILRSIPNLLTFRPADGNEVSGAYKVALTVKNIPSCLCLSRQKLPHLEYSDVDSVSLGGYTMIEGKDIIIVATGSEVSLAIDVIKELKGIDCGLVSMPCCELFDIQTNEYKKKVLPDNIKKISLEAGSTLGWYKYVNHCIGIDSFGASGKGNEVMNHFGFNKGKIISVILELLN